MAYITTPDPQRDLVYAMERRELRGHSRHRVAVKRLRTWTKRICRQQGISVPRVTIRSMTRYGILDTDFNPPLLVLDREYGQNFRALAHELAHHIVLERFGDRAQDHGPTWVKVYIRLLHCLRVIPEVGMQAVCRQYGIRYAR